MILSVFASLKLVIAGVNLVSGMAPESVGFFVHFASAVGHDLA
jgi:hypothetical protein